MRARTAKTARREAEARPFRDALKERVGRCEVCLRPRMVDYLACHEVANGPLRQTCLDKAFGILVVDRYPDFKRQTDCHRIVQNESEARQLARLYIARPSDFDLVAFNRMVNERAPNRITLAEVMAEVSNLFQSTTKGLLDD